MEYSKVVVINLFSLRVMMILQVEGCSVNVTFSVNISQGKCCLFKLQLVFLS